MKNDRFHYWLLFGFILTVLPLLLTSLKLYGTAAEGVTWWSLFKQVASGGELLVVSLALLGTNLGDLFKNECSSPLANLYMRGLSFIICLPVIYFFSEINSNPNFSKEYAFNLSITFFAISIIVCIISLFTPRK
jgi:hypothetical protein